MPKEADEEFLKAELAAMKLRQRFYEEMYRRAMPVRGAKDGEPESDRSEERRVP